MKHLRCLSYLLRHRWFVFVECLKMGIVWRGLTHDLSKFLPSEWFPYVEFFMGPRGVEAGGEVPPEVSQAFNVAWLKHQHRNPHHWQHWRLREDDGETKLLPMPLEYIQEMLADWRGAARAQGRPSIAPWFAANRDKIELHPASLVMLLSLMTAEERGELSS